MRLIHSIQVIATSGLAIALAGAPCFGGTVLHVDDDAPPGGDGQSWQTAFTYLQDALSAARGVGGVRGGLPGAGAEEVRVAQGRYQPDQDEGGNVMPGDREATFGLISGVSLMGGYAGLGAEDPDARDIELYETILTGDLAGDDEPEFVNYGENSYHVVSAIACNNTAIIDGFIITAGNADGETNSTWDRGGGFYNHDHSHPTLIDCTFRWNAASLGGGMYNDENSNPSLEYCAFTTCRAKTGAGMHNRHECSPNLSHCDFTDNQAEHAGGGIYHYISCSSTIIDCTFSNNDARHGAGIWNSSSSIEVIGCTFSDNSANYGGAIENYASSNAIVSGCVFCDNFAAGGGGGVYNSDRSHPNVSECTFFRNTAQSGGAICNDDWSHPIVIGCAFRENSAMDPSGQGGAMCNRQGSKPTVKDCTFSGNRSSRRGGAMYANSGGSPSVHTCIFTENTAKWGGAVFSEDGSPSFQYCTFSRNTADTGGGMCSDDSHTMVTHCDFTDNVALYGAGGMALDSGEAMVTECLFARNTGRGLACNATATVFDCAFIDNDDGGMWGAGDALLIMRCSFVGNTSDSGAGLAIDSESSIVIECDFIENSAKTGESTGGGGGLANYAGSVVDCAFIDNSADQGGALVVASGRVINCIFLNNSADAGGGMVMIPYLETVMADNCVFAGNEAEFGGAVYLYGIYGEILLANCTITNNTASANAGGVYNTNYGDTTIANCIAWGNTAPQLWHEGLSLEVVYTDVQDGWEGAGNIDADPLFIDAENTDYRLSSGSPCIDAADNIAVPPDVLDLDEDGDTEEPIPFDLDGNPRFMDDPDTEDTGHGEPPIVDMGAYEFQPDTCPADFDDDGDVDTADLLFLLGAWGTPDGDVDGDGDTDTSDLLALLAAWGECP